MKTESNRIKFDCCWNGNEPASLKLMPVRAEHPVL